MKSGPMSKFIINLYVNLDYMISLIEIKMEVTKKISS